MTHREAPRFEIARDVDVVERLFDDVRLLVGEQNVERRSGRVQRHAIRQHVVVHTLRDAELAVQRVAVADQAAIGKAQRAPILSDRRRAVVGGRHLELERRPLGDREPQVTLPELRSRQQLRVHALHERLLSERLQADLEIGDVDRRRDVALDAARDRAVAPPAVAFDFDVRERAFHGAQSDGAVGDALIRNHDARAHVAAVDVGARQRMPQLVQLLERDDAIRVGRSQRRELLRREHGAALDADLIHADRVDRG